MYRITQVIVKPKKNKELCAYFKDMCENYTCLKNDANFHIRQHMTGLGKPESELFDNQIKSINLFKKYIPKMCENSIVYHDKRVANILANKKLTEDEKQIKISKIKPLVVYEIPDKNKWFLDKFRICGVLRLYEDDKELIDKPEDEKTDDEKTGAYRKLPAQVNDEAVAEVCSEWKAYFKSSKDYNKNPSKYLGKPKIPRYYTGLSTVTLTNINCKFNFKDNNCILSFPKTKLTLNLGKYINGSSKLKKVEVKPIEDYFKVIAITEVADTVADLKESDRVAAIDIGGKNTITLTTNVSGLKPFVISGDILKTKNDNWLSAIDAAKSELRRGLDPKDNTKPYTSKKIKRMYANRDRFLSDYFHKISLYIINYCKKNDIDTLVIGRNKGQKQNINLGTENNRDFCYVPFTKLYKYLSYLCERNGINYIETEESYTSQASFFDGDEIPSVSANFHNNCSCKSGQDLHKSNENLGCTHANIKKDVSEVYSFSGNRTDRDTYVTKDGTMINADVNGSLNIMRKAVPKLCISIEIEDVMEVDTLGFEYFYPPYKVKIA